MAWKVSQIVKAVEGDLLFDGGDLLFQGISIDSRHIEKTELFIAIKGDVHDGHRFIPEVVDKGVRGIVCEKSYAKTAGMDYFSDALSDSSMACIGVDDTRKALGQLATYHLDRCRASVIAVTGSNGKTTTREMIYQVIGRKFATLSSSGSFNNDIGMPLTLLKLEKHHQWVVLELGMNHPGEIASLSAICRPNIGVITNIGTAHLEGLGSLDAIRDAKGEIFDNIRSDGFAVLNADDDQVLKLASQLKTRNYNGNVVWFGVSDNADVRARDVMESDAGLEFTLTAAGRSHHVRLKTHGRFMVYNALAAAAVGNILGLNLTEIAQGLEKFRPVAKRMNIEHLKNGIHLIDDTYNANPVSMRMALMTLQSLKGENRGIFVAGDMLELGSFSDTLHEQIGFQAASLGVAKMFITGTFSPAMKKGAIRAGLAEQQIFTGDKTQIIQALKSDIRKNDWILIKGSRGMKMEDVVEGIRQWADT